MSTKTMEMPLDAALELADKGSETGGVMTNLALKSLAKSVREMRRHFAVCSPPDHTDEHDCLDRSVGCSKHGLCCMGALAIPFPNAL